jgi:hypothetical protein
MADGTSRDAVKRKLSPARHGAYHTNARCLSDSARLDLVVG